MAESKRKPLPRKKSVTTETSVGVRELKDSLSEHLRRVREGAVITITDRGEPVAQLIPAGIPAGIRRMMSEGRITWSGRRMGDPGPPLFKLPPGSKTSTEYIREERDERD